MSERKKAGTLPGVDRVEGCMKAGMGQWRTRNPRPSKRGKTAGKPEAPAKPPAKPGGN